MILTICIPTYNRANYLKICLNNLLPQVVNHLDQIEIIVIDNASTDDTNIIVNNFKKVYPFLKYHKNLYNLGYTGNQIKSYTLPIGFYTAFLSDDDVYVNPLIDNLLPILNLKKYSFIALNYYSFKDNIYKIYKTNFAPIDNIEFDRAYDILNYPSVGHWSGFIVNSEIAKNTLNSIINIKTLTEFEKNRGIIGEIIHRALSITKQPSFFYGQRLLAVNVPQFVDYDVFNHLYINDYKFYLELYKQNYILESDLHYRKNLILIALKKSILTQSFKYTKEELINIRNEFDLIFINEIRYFNKIRPYFNIVNNYPVRIFIKIVYKIYKKIKY